MTLQLIIIVFDNFLYKYVLILRDSYHKGKETRMDVAMSAYDGRFEEKNWLWH